MKKNLFAIFLAGLTLIPLGAQAAFDACLGYFPGKVVPKVTHKVKLRDICFDSFAVLHSGETKTPVYTVEKLNRAHLAKAKGIERTNKFYEEARLPMAERATLKDYNGSGYDRGHQAPAGDMPTPAAMAQSFSLANMVPQSPENNRGAWARRVEAATRHYVERAKGDVYVFTGPAFKGSVKKIGRGRVWVPTHLFKLVYDPNTQRAWAYWLENTDDVKVTKPISYRELVNRIGIELLPSVPLKG
ncbi:DNA/RNA non-specific endonuclease [Comamonas jiangduensis]|uniref:Endonuclease n=1 Tax=Comamonas jiangduensis TaxID=1194168 RepID=A0ABV4I826_9BURK